MASFIYYCKSLISKDGIEENKYTPIASLAMSPYEALKRIFPNHYVVDFLGIEIPSYSMRSESNYENSGLKIRELPGKNGLEKAIKKLNKNKLFRDCRHKFTEEENKRIYEAMLTRIEEPALRAMRERSFCQQDCINISRVFKVLGYNRTPQEIEIISAPFERESYIENGGIIPSWGYFDLEELFS